MESYRQKKLDASNHRIVVVRTSGSGKGIPARHIASRLVIPHIKLDSLYWEPARSHVSIEALRRKVDSATRAAAWVIDGTYSSARCIVWLRA